MNLEGIRVLLVEDNPADARILAELLRDHPAGRLALDHAERLGTALERLSRDHYDVVLLDLSLPDSRGLETVIRLHTHAPKAPIVVLTSLDDEALAVKAVRAGAQDYLVKGRVDADLLIRSLRYASERGRVLEALERREEHYRSLIENSLDVVSILNADGTIRYASPSTERVLGYPATELIGRNALSLVHHDDLDMARTYFEQADASGTVQLRFRHKDSSWRVLEASGRNLAQVPGVRGMVVNARDVTERKRLEEQLHHSQRLEAVGRLAGGVAHDFNNLLMVISGYSRMLLDNASPSDPSHSDLEQVVKAADRATELTRQLLAFSRRQTIQPVPVNLNLLIQEMERMLRRVLGADIQLVSELSPDIDHVRADPGQIEQVLLNLALNARDAMPDGGQLTVQTSKLTLEPGVASSHPVASGSDYIVLTVADTGPGMEPQVLSRIYEPFFTTKEGGTGLGLATSYGIIKQSGGEICAESKPGAGTTFRIYLPAIDQVSGPAPAPRKKTSTRGSETILLVEDEEGVRRVVETMLRRQGYKVLTPSSSTDALSMAKAHRETIHLLITDLVMPGLSGRKIAEHLVAERPEMRVLYVSGNGEPPSPAESAFLQKPFSVEELALKVRAVLQTAP